MEYVTEDSAPIFVVHEAYDRFGDSRYRIIVGPEDGTSFTLYTKYAYPPSVQTRIVEHCRERGVELTLVAEGDAFDARDPGDIPRAHYNALEGIWRRYADGRMRLLIGPNDDGNHYTIYTKYPLTLDVRSQIKAAAVEHGLRVHTVSEPEFMK